MFQPFFPFRDYGHYHHRHCGGGIYNNLIVNAPQECYRHHYFPPYWQQYPMPVINENITQIQGQSQGQRQGS
jgi:hypothetical protein